MASICSVCGRPLTHPDSIARGMGPVCSGMPTSSPRRGVGGRRGASGGRAGRMPLWEQEGRDKGENRRDAAFGHGQQGRFPGTGRMRKERDTFGPAELPQRRSRTGRQQRRSSGRPQRLTRRNRQGDVGAVGGLNFNPSAAAAVVEEREEGEE